MSGIIFNTRTIPGFPQHLEIISGTLFNALCFQMHFIFFEICNPFFHFVFYFLDRFLHPLFIGYIMFCRENFNGFRLLDDFSCQWINAADSFHFIPKKRNPVGILIFIRRKYFDCVAPDTKYTGVQIQIISGILTFDQVS